MESHKGQVGNSITIQCSGWNVWFWTDIQSSDKYLCRDPCENILIRARSQQTAQRDRIHLNNTGSQLTITFTDLQMEDSGTYVCGVKESGIDSYKTFDLTVTEAVITTTSRPTATKPAPTVTPDVFTTHQNPSTNFPFSDGTQLGGKAIASTSIFLPCLFVGIVVMVALCLLIFIKCRNRKPSRTTERKKRVDEDTPEVSPLYVNYKEDIEWRQRDPPAGKGKSSTIKELQEDLYANSAFTNHYKVKTNHTQRCL